MRMKPITALAITLTTASMLITLSSGASKSKNAGPSKFPSKLQDNKARQDPPGTIDGRINPELIPDQAAYIILFRLLSNQQEQVHKQGIRAYIRQMGLGSQVCSICPVTKGGEANSDDDIDMLITVAEEFHRRVSVLDKEARDIKDRTWPNPSQGVTSYLTTLQMRKEAIVTDLITSLPNRFDSKAMEKIRRHVNEHIKSRMKIYAGPSTLPGGADWQPVTSTGSPQGHR